tara:strand:- start:1039 stop:1266 length:228 start_codon:yes stop_codon:yes gene_type:complete
MNYKLINREDGSCDVIFDADGTDLVDGFLAFNCPDRDRALIAADELQYVFKRCVPGYRSDGTLTITDEISAQTVQ